MGVDGACCRYRDLLETTLHGTGLSQADVVKWLADQLLQDALFDVIGEVHELHEAITSIILDSL